MKRQYGATLARDTLVEKQMRERAKGKWDSNQQNNFSSASGDQ